jgi:hypothetical protein
MRTIILSVSLLIALLKTSAAQQPTFKAAFERGHEIFVTDSSGNTAQITHDGIPKDLPLFSSDGTRLAFLQKPAQALSLVDLRIVDSSGKNIATVPVRPENSSTTNDLPSVDRLQWLPNDQVVVSGSLNPSTEESIILDAKTGKELNSIYDDAGGAVFSPDGIHVAYVTGSAHFMPAEDKRPIVNIDQEQVYPKGNVKIELQSNVAWSDDSKEISFVAKDSGAATQLVVCPLARACGLLDLSQAAPPFTVSWSGMQILLNSAGKTLSIDPKMGQITPFTPPPAKAAEQESLRLRIENEGGRSIDVWCDGCTPSSSRRKTRTN